MIYDQINNNLVNFQNLSKIIILNHKFDYLYLK